jgi:hypothetical protein
MKIKRGEMEGKRNGKSGGGVGGVAGKEDKQDSRGPGICTLPTWQQMKKHLLPVLSPVRHPTIESQGNKEIKP